MNNQNDQGKKNLDQRNEQGAGSQSDAQYGGGKQGAGGMDVAPTQYAGKEGQAGREGHQQGGQQQHQGGQRQGDEQLGQHPGGEQAGQYGQKQDGQQRQGGEQAGQQQGGERGKGSSNNR